MSRDQEITLTQTEREIILRYRSGDEIDRRLVETALRMPRKRYRKESDKICRIGS